MMDNATGFVGIVVPAKKIAIGFYLSPSLREHGENILKTVRASITTDAVKVLQHLDGKSNDGQAIGFLSQIICKYAQDGDILMVPVGMALSLITKLDFFYVQADRDENDTGTYSSIINLPDGILEAQFQFANIPIVKEILGTIESVPRRWIN